MVDGFYDSFLEKVSSRQTVNLLTWKFGALLLLEFTNWINNLMDLSDKSLGCKEYLSYLF